MFRRHPFLTFATLAYLGLVAWITLSPQSGSPTGNPLYRLAEFFGRHSATHWITFNVLEFTANILMFMPLGLFLVLLFGRRQWWIAILAGVVLTITIEYTQTFLPTRVPDIRDIIANSLGATLGTLFALVVTARRARRRRAERRSGYPAVAPRRA